jgi:hypothetical protein
MFNGTVAEGGDMDINRAKEIVSALAEGIDPTTGEIMPDNSVYNKGDVVRALYTVLAYLDDNKAKKQQPRNAGKPWTESEDDKLRDEFDSMMKISDIAKEHGRTYKAIESRLDYLGLKKKPFWMFARKRT